MNIDLDFTIGSERPGSVVHALVEEALSAPYEASVVVALPADDGARAMWLGRAAALGLTGYGVTRLVRGVVTRVEELGRTAVARYVRVRVEPALALLDQRSDVRIFQETSVADIVRDVLREAGAYAGPRPPLADAVRFTDPYDHEEVIVRHWTPFLDGWLGRQ